jgi:di/tricarboxylate transporter
MNKWKKILVSLIVPALVLIFRPLDLSLEQAAILASLLLVLTFWINKSVGRTLSSVFLLVSFLIFSGTSPDRILFFPLSENFYLIIFSFLFSEGIVKSKLIDRLFKPYIGYLATTPIRLLMTISAMAFIMIFMVPLPFCRLIMLAMIFREFYDGLGIRGKLRELLLFIVFLISMIMNTFLLRADIIMNTAVVNISGIQISEARWFTLLTLPGTGMLFISLALFLLVYKKELVHYSPGKNGKPKLDLIMEDWINLSIIAFTIALWALEKYHPIPSAGVILIGTILMFIRRILTLQDLKAIEWPLMIFLTATFSIGAAMTGSGTAGILFGRLSLLFPDTFSIWMIIAVMGASILIHMILGSVVTTMSVVIPGMAIATAGIMPETAMPLLVFISVVAHFLLPFHNVHLVIGEGYGFFSSKTVTGFGLYMTVVTIVSILLFYLPWWNFVGIL